jgi:hypothetical protein
MTSEQRRPGRPEPDATPELSPREGRALEAIVGRGAEAEIDPDAGRALARRGLVVEGGAPDAPTFTASDAGRALVARWQEEEQAYMAGRALVLDVLSDDHAEWWMRAELRERITDIHPATAEAELSRLVGAGVVLVDGERVKASPCARYLDHLNLIGV